MASFEGSDQGGLRTRHLLAGLQAGIHGSFLLLLVSMAGSLLSRRSIWSLPNLFSTSFYGDVTYGGPFTARTLPGLALFFVIYGLLGMLWGAVIREGEDSILPAKSLLLFWSAAFGVLCFYVAFYVAWPRINPLVPLYAPFSNLRAGHLLWGIALSRSASYARRIAASNAAPTDTDVDPEIKSGEVIV